MKGWVLKGVYFISTLASKIKGLWRIQLWYIDVYHIFHRKYWIFLTYIMVSKLPKTKENVMLTWNHKFKWYGVRNWCSFCDTTKYRLLQTERIIVNRLSRKYLTYRVSNMLVKHQTAYIGKRIVYSTYW